MANKTNYILSEYKFKPILIASLCNYAGGGKLIHSLLDNHPDILTLPISPAIFCKLKSFNSYKKNQILNQLYNCKEFFDSRYDLRKGNNQIGKNKNQYIKVDRKIFKHHLIRFLNANKWNLKNYLLSVYISFQISQNRNFSKKKFISIYLHDIFFLKEVYLVFQKPIILCSVRLPINSFTSYTRNMYIKSRQFNITYQSRFLNYFYSFFEFNKINNKIHCIVVEELHREPNNTMRKLCSLLKIKFHKNILISTIDGKLWFNPRKYSYNGFNYDHHKQINYKEVDKKILQFFSDILEKFHLFFNYSNTISSNKKVKFPYISISKYYFNLFLFTYRKKTKYKNLKGYFKILKNFIKELIFLRKETERVLKIDSNFDYRKKLVLVNINKTKYF